MGCSMCKDRDQGQEEPREAKALVAGLAFARLVLEEV